MEPEGTGNEVRVLSGALVAMLDILGAKSMDTARAQLAVQQLQRSVDFVRNQAPHHCEIVARVLGLEEAHVEPPRFRLFGDSVVFVWAPERPKPPASLMPASLWLRALLFAALQNGLPLRGAIGVGDVVISERTILGPGVVDAAEWYEAADWIGVIATPRCALLWEALAVRQGQGTLAELCVPWGVPLKGGQVAHMWALSWPPQLAQVVHLLSAMEPPERDPRRMLLLWLAQNPIPKGAESKYQNALAFYDAFQALYPELMAQPNSLAQTGEAIR